MSCYCTSASLPIMSNNYLDGFFLRLLGSLLNIHINARMCFYVMWCMFNVEEEVVVIRNGWTPKEEREEKVYVINVFAANVYLSWYGIFYTVRVIGIEICLMSNSVNISW